MLSFKVSLVIYADYLPCWILCCVDKTYTKQLLKKQNISSCFASSRKPSDSRVSLWFLCIQRQCSLHSCLHLKNTDSAVCWVLPSFYSFTMTCFLDAPVSKSQLCTSSSAWKVLTFTEPRFSFCASFLTTGKTWKLERQTLFLRCLCLDVLMFKWSHVLYLVWFSLPVCCQLFLLQGSYFSWSHWIDSD